jgi:hypothetical protein
MRPYRTARGTHHSKDMGFHLKSEACEATKRQVYAEVMEMLVAWCNKLAMFDRQAALGKRGAAPLPRGRQQ